ncbi:hypothetical protein GCM10010271_49440 [Streptomyces kurssanovii]|nr:hypothetical protein GCM10010271_49440 [Streptomyces kurssanovii]
MADDVGGAVLLAALDLVAVLVLQLLGQQVLAAPRVDGGTELRMLRVDARVDDGDPDALARGLLPQFVQKDPLQGPGPAFVLLVRVGALAR